MVDFAWYDAGLLGMFVCSLAGVTYGVSSALTDKADDYSTWKAWKRAMELIIPQSRLFVLSLTAAIFESICSTLQPVYMGSVLDMITDIGSKGDKDVKVDFDKMTYTCVTIVCLDAMKCVAIS